MSLLLSTKLRSSLFSYLFTHADESFYVRELADIINEDAGNLSRELRKFEAEGLLRHSFKGRIKLYSLDKRYPMFGELKKIVSKTEGVEGSIRKVVGGFKGIELAVIYGSYAKDREKKASDIDLIVVGSIPRDEFTRKIRELESRLNREINFTVYKRNEFDRERSRQGGFLGVVLKGDIIILKGSIDDR